MALKNKVFLTLLTVSLLAVFAFFVWNNMKAFVGNSIKNPNSYVLEFEEMNREDTYVIPACQDDVFVVNFRIDKGHADLIIAIDGKSPIYKGNDIVTGAFEVIAPETVEYRININARHASGFIEVYAKKGEENIH